MKLIWRHYSFVQKIPLHMPIRTALILLSLSVLTPVYTQQLPLFTQYREYHGYLNPAAINSDYLLYESNLAVSASYRSQWGEVEGGPRDLFLKGEFLWRTDGAFDLLSGAHVIRDEADPFSFTGAYLRFAAVLADDPYFGALALGFNLGLLQYRVTTDDLQVREANDPRLTSAGQSLLSPDIGAGIFYHRQLLNGDNIYGGFSIPQLAALELAFQGRSSQFSIQQERHFFFLLGYYHYLKDGAFIEPSAWVRHVPGLPLSVDLNCRYTLASQLWMGAGISTQGAMHLEAGYVAGDLKTSRGNLKIGYGFDFGLFNAIGKYFGPAHEVNLAWVMDTRKKRF